MDRRDAGTVKRWCGLLCGAIIVLWAILGAGGCITTQLKATSDSPVEASMDVFVQASVLQHMMDSACFFRFSTPPEMAAASPMLSSVFETRLVQRRPFAQIRVIARKVSSDAEALWYARKEGCSLAIAPSLLYMMDGSGGEPTKLVVRIRILDAATGQVLWDIKQSAWSNPCPDIDLTWNTVVGAPAQRCRVLAECLADRFAGYLVQSLEQEKKQREGER